MQRHATTGQKALLLQSALSFTLGVRSYTTTPLRYLSSRPLRSGVALPSLHNPNKYGVPYLSLFRPTPSVLYLLRTKNYVPSQNNAPTKKPKHNTGSTQPGPSSAMSLNPEAIKEATKRRKRATQKTAAKDVKSAYQEKGRGPPILSSPEDVRSDQVQLIGLECTSLGIVPTADAFALASQHRAILALVGAAARPPVLRMTTYEALRAEQQKRQTLALTQGKKREAGEKRLKELRFSSTIAEHDVGIKVDRLRSFLERGHKVKVCVFFKHHGEYDVELGEALLENIIERVEDLGKKEGNVELFGSTLSLLLGPKPTAAGKAQEKKTTSTTTPTTPKSTPDAQESTGAAGPVNE